MTDREFEDLKKGIAKYNRRRRLFKLLAWSGVLVPAALAIRHLGSVRKAYKVHDETNPNLSNNDLQRELNRLDFLPKARVSGASPYLKIGKKRIDIDVPADDERQSISAFTLPDTNEAGFDFKNPYILSNTRHPTVLRHELGHAMDMQSGKWEKDFLPPTDMLGKAKEALLAVFAPSRSIALKREISAWENAKVDKDDALRRAALNTYRTAGQYGVARSVRAPAVLTGLGGMVYNGFRQNQMIDRHNEEVLKREEEERRKKAKEQIMKELARSKKVPPPKPASGTRSLAKAASKNTLHTRRVRDIM